MKGKMWKICLLAWSLVGSCWAGDSFSKYVNKWIGTGGDARVIPVASVPFGMMQLGPDTRSCGSGYHYDDSTILGFSHLHKNGGGCADFLDILFLPLSSQTDRERMDELHLHQLQAVFSHQDEKARPGYYSVLLYDGNLQVELTATRRCGIQRYRYASVGRKEVLLDLEHGSQCACTIQPEHDVDTVYYAAFEQVDAYTVRGCRHSNGWATGQQVYFYTRFSAPIKECRIYQDNRPVEGNQAECRNLRVLFSFGEEVTTLEVRTALSAVDWEGARANLEEETEPGDFDSFCEAAIDVWEAALGQIEVETSEAGQKELFYTSLHNVLMYPFLFSDVDFRFRGPDGEVHRTAGFDYYGGVVGLWDTFRAACPLTALLHPDVMSDYVKTALEHYRYQGQLPIWTLWGKETYQMIGIHSLPLITNCFLNGIRQFDTRLALEAMVASASKDTCGWSMGYFVGLKNYKKYGYVPCDLEMESVARTLEYAYDDYALARFAEQLGDSCTASAFYKRSKNYRNVIDPATLLARGRYADGRWRTPFDPLASVHRRDDYCEGNAWQWTFFVPHDVEGLAEWMGGKEVLTARLDSLFSQSSQLNGELVSGDISGLIGQYAHGNEPGHHTIYMYNRVGKPKRTQQYVHRVLTELYRNTPDGICGNEDTGQMSAWYVFSALGFYPLDPVSGRYELGTPLFPAATIHLPSGKDFRIETRNFRVGQPLVKQVYLNGKRLDRTYLTFGEVLQGGTLLVEMK